MLSSVLLSLLLSGLMIDGLEGGVLEWQVSGVDDYGNSNYEIALSMDDGASFSGWVDYPPRFNPAKTFCRYSVENATLEVSSQLPFTAEYTYAWYHIANDGSLELFDYGFGHYYQRIQKTVSRMLDSGEFDEACNEAYCIIYPGSMPEPDFFCAEFVVAAAAIGTMEAFDWASSVSLQISNKQLYLLTDSSLDYINALEMYADLSNETTTELVMERLAEYE